MIIIGRAARSGSRRSPPKCHAASDPSKPTGRSVIRSHRVTSAMAVSAWRGSPAPIARATNRVDVTPSPQSEAWATMAAVQCVNPNRPCPSGPRLRATQAMETVAPTTRTRKARPLNRLSRAREDFFTGASIGPLGSRTSFEGVDRLILRDRLGCRPL